MKIFPPSGVQNKERSSSLPDEEREYMMFCLEFCDRVLRDRPGHFDALSLAAGYFTELGYFADGLRVDKMLTAMRPEDPTVLYNLACSFSLNCLFDDAIAVLEKAVARGYADHRHMRTDRDLTALRRDPRFDKLADAAEERAVRIGFGNS